MARSRGVLLLTAAASKRQPGHYCAVETPRGLASRALKANLGQQ